MAGEALFERWLHIDDLGVLSLPEVSKHSVCSKTPSHKLPNQKKTGSTLNSSGSIRFRSGIY